MNLLGNSVFISRTWSSLTGRTFAGLRRAGGNTSHLRVALLRGCGPAGPLFFLIALCAVLLCGCKVLEWPIAAGMGAYWNAHDDPTAVTETNRISSPKDKP